MLVYDITLRYAPREEDDSLNLRQLQMEFSMARLRPISLLRLSLLRLLDSNFPGNSLPAWEFHPLILILCLSQTL